MTGFFLLLHIVAIQVYDPEFVFVTGLGDTTKHFIHISQEISNEFYNTEKLYRDELNKMKAVTLDTTLRKKDTTKTYWC